MSEYNFSDRQLQILTYLKTNEVASKQQLEQLCHMNERTIRNDIRDINEQCKQNVILYYKMKGYQLIADFEDFEQKPVKAEHNRLFYIIKSLLFHDDPVDIFDFSESLYVSEATIEKDLLKIKQQYLTQSKLTLVRNNGLLYLKGEEKQKRSFFCDLLIRESSMNNFDLHMFEHCFEYVQIPFIDRIVKKVLEKHHLSFSDAVYMNLTLHIGIACERNILHQSDYTHQIQGFEVEDRIIAQEITEALQKHYTIAFSEYEKEYLALLIHAKKSHRENNGQTKDLNYLEITRQLIAYIASAYDIDFRNDHALEQDLSVHLQGMHARLQSETGSHNVLMEEIKHTYPFIFEMGVDIASFYEQQAHERMNADEVGFVVLHLVCAFERYHHQQTVVSAIIVCPTGYSSSKILEIKLHNAFFDMLEIVEICSVNQFLKGGYQHIDLVISTVVLPECQQQQFICSPLITHNDIEQLDQLIRKLLKAKNPSDISSFFEPSLFFTDIDFSRKEEVISYLGKQLHQQGYVQSDFIASVLEREAFSTTAYREGMAIPHPMKMEAMQTKVAVGVMKKPIEWGKHKVSLVFLLAIRAEDKRRLFDLYEGFGRLSEQKELFKQLLTANSCEEFIAIFQLL